MTRRQRTAAVSAALWLFLATPGCSSKKSFENENDDLRRRVTALESELEGARARAVEAEAKLLEFARSRESTEQGRALEALPRTAGISIGRYSGFVRPDLGDQPNAIDVYVKPFDGRQRFVQVAGSLRVEALLLPEQLGAESADSAGRRLAVLELTPEQVREAYRSSPLGTHYYIRLELPDDARNLKGTLVLRAELREPIAGQVHRTETIVESR
ncbi:MAG: hypothetical protein AB7G17_04995 [Phycisphaerales bacterium]